jgi:anthranilate/para-aminobenzoate synthase component I
MYPTFSQFARWASRYRVIPMWIEPELPSRDILEWAHSFSAQDQNFFFLHSASSGHTEQQSGGLAGQPAGRQARYSYLALDAPRYHVEARGDTLTLHHRTTGGSKQEAIKIGNPYERFYGWFSQLTGPTVEALPPFWGGAVGFLGYESSGHLEPKLAELFGGKQPKSASLAIEKFPEFEFGVYDAVAAVDHARGRLWLVHSVFLPEGRALSPVQLERLYRQGQDRLRRYAVAIQKAVHRRRAWGSFHAGEIKCNRSEAAYRLMVRRAKGYIAAGDVYQCNISQNFSAEWSGDPWTLYRDLAEINPSPYAALWRSGTRWMVSASPELLYRLEAGRVETRPIAGTYPRRGALSNDRWIAQSLVRDVKERAEHIMLVDLERNDLGRVCLPSTVRVSETLTQELYSHVIHLVSSVHGILSPGRSWKDLLQAGFPGGTITGCPKLRSMEIIHKLEPHKRGPYTGSLGWIGFTGDATMNILIRTLFLDKDRLSFPVGAGIVADSDPKREYQETLHKAGALLEALQAAWPDKTSQPMMNVKPRRPS